jgi:hypothetical protein
VLLDCRLPAIDRSAGRATLLALLLLAAIPAAAQARTFKVDGRVTGPPNAKGGAVTVPLQLTRRSGDALNLGTRNVGVRLSRRGRLRLSGAGASGASRLTPSALRAGDRLKGVTSLSRRARIRLRWHVRPTMKLKRARVIRPAARALGTPGGTPGGTRPLPPFSGVPGIQGPGAQTPLSQIVASLQAQTSILAPRADELGPVAQKIEARSLQLESVQTGLDDVKVAFDGLETALGQVDPMALASAIAEVDALRARVELLKDGIGPLESSLGDLEGALGKVRGAVDKLVPTVATLAAQVALIQQTPDAPARVGELEVAATRLNGRLDTAEAGLSSFESDMGGLTAGMASLVGSIDALTGAAVPGADTGNLSAAVSGLGPAVAGLESGFASLHATGTGLVSTADGIETDAILLETTVGELCSLVSTTCP